LAVQRTQAEGTPKDCYCQVGCKIICSVKGIVSDKIIMKQTQDDLFKYKDLVELTNEQVWVVWITQVGFDH